MVVTCFPISFVCLQALKLRLVDSSETGYSFGQFHLQPFGVKKKAHFAQWLQTTRKLIVLQNLAPQGRASQLSSIQLNRRPINPYE